ncbi:MAG TPA: CrcB family protein [Acidimicrobiales bacterium]|nr:CrcB family protein [Acidimicrobiales bacterium]
MTPTSTGHGLAPLVVGRIPIADTDPDLNRSAPPSGRRAPARSSHPTPLTVALVMGGGVLGASAREAVEQALPGSTRGFPTATFLINLSGAFVLGVLLEVLVRSGEDAGWRRRARLVGGTGFCGAFTTYSTLAVETAQLGRHGAWSTAAGYLAASVIGGLVVTVVGIMVGAAHARRSAAALPVDPDVDRPGRRP